MFCSKTQQGTCGVRTQDLLVTCSVVVCTFYKSGIPLLFVSKNVSTNAKRHRSLVSTYLLLLLRMGLGLRHRSK